MIFVIAYFAIVVATLLLGVFLGGQAVSKQVISAVATFDATPKEHRTAAMLRTLIRHNAALTGEISFSGN